MIFVMKNLFKQGWRLMALLVACMASGGEMAAISDYVEIDGIWYLTDDDTKTATVRVPDYEWQLKTDEEGFLEIPGVVTYEDVAYRVTGIHISFQNQLRVLKLPESIEILDGLIECDNLESITMPGVRTIRYSSLNNLPSLREIVFGENTQLEIQAECLNAIGVESINLPAGLEELNGLNFRNCPNLLGLDLSALKSLVGSLVNNCESLEWLHLPKNLMCLETTSSFHDLPNLTQLELPASVPEGFRFISCFFNLPSLKTIYAPSPTPISVMYVSDYGNIPPPYSPALQSGMSQEITFDFTNIGGDDIDADNCVVYVPEGCVEAYKSHPSWKIFKNIVAFDFSSSQRIEPDSNDVAVTVADGGIRVAGDTGFKVYDIAGRRCGADGLLPGIYFIHTSDGKTAKVHVN